MRLPIAHAAAALLALAPAAFAEDAVTAAPDHYEVILENDQVRVLRATYGPGETAPMHEHPANVAVTISGEGTATFTLADGTVIETENEPGLVEWYDPVEHSVVMGDDGGIEAILIEIKE